MTGPPDHIVANIVQDRLQVLRTQIDSELAAFTAATLTMTTNTQRDLREAISLMRNFTGNDSLASAFQAAEMETRVTPFANQSVISIMNLMHDIRDEVSLATVLHDSSLDTGAPRQPDQDERHTCPICLEETDGEHDCYTLRACGHAFHHTCFRRLVATNTDRCPVCRCTITREAVAEFRRQTR